MKTEVLMQRTLFGKNIKQKSSNGFFSATDLLHAGNFYRASNGMGFFNLTNYFKNVSSQDFIKEVENKYGTCVYATRGRNGETWVHPLIFIDIALHIDPKLKLEVYEWIFDSLIKYRNDSGDSYKEMSAGLFTRCTNIKEFPKLISDVAVKIKFALNVNDWQTATEEQLKKRDLIHNSIKLLCKVLTDTNQIVRIAIEEHMPKNPS